MLVEVRKNVFLNPDHVVSVWFDVAAGKLVIQCIMGHHSFVLLEGEMVEAAVARVAELLNKSQKRTSKGAITNSVTVSGDVKPVMPNPQNVTK